MEAADRAISAALAQLSREKGSTLAAGRYRKFRRMGAPAAEKEKQ